MSEPLTREQRINLKVNDAIGWDDRKHLLDVWQDAGIRVERITPELYAALIAVAQFGARRVAENGADW